MRILFIPDTQVQPGVNTDHLEAAGNYLVSKKPDVVVMIGDWWDMPSLNSYEKKGSSYFHDKSYASDVESGKEAMERFLMPLNKYNSMRKRNKKKAYKPRMVFTTGNHECYSEDTDVLIKRGEDTLWSPISEVVVGDKVFTISGEWEEVSDTTSYDYEGDMYNFKNRRTDLLVTPNHRMYYQNSGKVKVKNAEDMPRCCNMINSSENHGIKSADDFDIMMNAWLHTDSYHGQKYPVLYQSGEKALHLKSLLDRNGVDHTFRERNRDITHICGKELKNVQTSYEFYLKESQEIKSNKYIDDSVWEYDKESFDKWLEWMCFFDGTKTTRGTDSKVFYGALPIIEDLQKHLVTRGYLATIKEYREGHYRLNIVRRKVTRKDQPVDIVPYNGKVYCVKVPKNENLLVRRNGKCCFSGNSRITRAIKEDPRLKGTISLDDLELEKFGWEVYPFLKIVEIEGILYSHYFVNPDSLTNNPVGGTIENKLKLIGHSFAMGHQQKRQYGNRFTATGKELHGLVCGAFYSHHEDYLGEQGDRQYWRGLVLKNEVKDGTYDPCFLSLDYLVDRWL